MYVWKSDIDSEESSDMNSMQIVKWHEQKMVNKQ